MSRGAQRRRWLASAALAFVVSCSWMARAQPHEASGGGIDASAHGFSLKTRLGPSVALRLLRSARDEDRLRGIRRLGGLQSYAAIQLLLRAIGDDPTLVSKPKRRLEVVRALAPFASREPVRRLLLAWVKDTAKRGPTASPVGILARDQAAMALAASSNARAIEQLVLSVIDGDEAGKRSARALVAHPPRTLEPLLRSSSLASPQVVEVLGKMGDLRSIPKLRSLLDKADLDVRVAAAVALARLGDASGVKLARDWISQGGSTYPLRVGAARTLMLTRDPLAPRALAILLADPATRAVGLSLVERAPTPQLSPSLAGLLTIARGQERVRILSALALAGGPLATKTLEGLVSKSPDDVDVAFALAHCRDPAAAPVITKMLANPAMRRMAARVGLVRTIELGEEPDGLRDALATLAASHDASDRSVGVFGLVITQQASVADYAGSRDAVTVMAACRASLGLPVTSRLPCQRRLAREPDPVVRSALAGTLIGSETLEGVSTSTLLEWAESTQLSAPIFGRALGLRDDAPFRSRIERLLESGDPVMRSQVAIGLGRSPRASAATLLARAYRFEVDPRVRSAMVLGLAARRCNLGRAWVQRAVTLDPDGQVRNLARQVLAGRSPRTLTRGHRVLWLRISDSSGSASTASRPVRIVTSSGFATLAITAPDGQVLVPGLTPGETIVRAASPVARQEKIQR